MVGINEADFDSSQNAEGGELCVRASPNDSDSILAYWVIHEKDGFRFFAPVRPHQVDRSNEFFAAGLH